ncbi:hypothetical protein CYMTET_53877 [Cymbomonas tetramitiformis]|uniref:Uncharacterized protein n=1 Tax=Cymbomonas tetramitiformis TaxID=36881 RepID=A0AAE0BGC5_9CHLO|nr:hypothetical protein CYMTET_53877 [Cymbomonas tetramitiformis]
MEGLKFTAAMIAILGIAMMCTWAWMLASSIGFRNWNAWHEAWFADTTFVIGLLYFTFGLSGVLGAQAFGQRVQRGFMQYHAMGIFTLLMIDAMVGLLIALDWSDMKRLSDGTTCYQAVVHWAEAKPGLVAVKVIFAGLSFGSEKTPQQQGGITNQGDTDNPDIRQDESLPVGTNTIHQEDGNGRGGDVSSKNLQNARRTDLVITSERGAKVGQSTEADFPDEMLQQSQHTSTMHQHPSGNDMRPVVNELRSHLLQQHKVADAQEETE